MWVFITLTISHAPVTCITFSIEVRLIVLYADPDGVKRKIFTPFETSTKCRSTSAFMWYCVDIRHMSISDVFWGML